MSRVPSGKRTASSGSTSLRCAVLLDLRLGRSKRIKGQGIHHHADRRADRTALLRVSGDGSGERGCVILQVADYCAAQDRGDGGSARQVVIDRQGDLIIEEGAQ